MKDNTKLDDLKRLAAVARYLRWKVDTDPSYGSAVALQIAARNHKKAVLESISVVENNIERE